VIRMGLLIQVVPRGEDGYPALVRHPSFYFYCGFIASNPEQGCQQAQVVQVPDRRYPRARPLGCEGAEHPARPMAGPLLPKKGRFRRRARLPARR
jgi:hypothetical protein